MAGSKKNAVLSSVLSSDADKIRETMESMDEDVFEQAVDTILNARKIM